MKIHFILLLLFILQLHFSLYTSQIYKGPKLETGEVNRGSTGWNITRGLERYEWSYCKLKLHDNYTGFEAEVEFHPRVDEFTTLTIPYSNATLMRNPNITISLVFPGNRSIITYFEEKQTVSLPCVTDGTRNPDPQCNTNPLPDPDVYSTVQSVTKNVTTYESLELEAKHTYDPNQEAFVNYFTAIVQLDKGTIIDAIWDGDRDEQICKDCGTCIDQQCAVKANNMVCDTEEALCNLKIFVAWAGVDSKGKTCISINKIPSNFRKYSLTPISQFGLGLANDFIYRVDQNTANPNQA
ncbi:hypothetical protein DLAC_07032 [Tieghemostelium lacteum]|uniref:4Fe-4S ferredoxin-type domain-containing protein n=1 Tax=Tieghemostelium lacteum TaxID=361077 RepID=A0A151ZE05_TIELA|nr:hypothetical protein DLAC_07032 [Tieghemostelium lacteum]|eukprot:KYQ92186.1 hypothetical protein DLAC_07032 [Tieghemostelium lacteum]